MNDVDATPELPGRLGVAVQLLAHAGKQAGKDAQKAGATLTSMFDEPSSGSIATIYFASFDISDSIGIYSSFSSEATMQHSPPCFKAETNRSLA